MNIWIIGGGSIGLLFAAKLHTAGENVLLMTRTPEQASAIRNDGITLIDVISRQTSRDNSKVTTMDQPDTQNQPSQLSPQSSQQLQAQQVNLYRAVDITVPIEEMLDRYGQPDWVWLAIKQTALDNQMTDFLGTILRRVPQARVLTLMNGIGHIERLHHLTASHSLYAAVVSEGAKRTSPTTVEHTGSGVTRVGLAISADVDKLQDHGIDKVQVHDVDKVQEHGIDKVQNHDVNERTEQNLKQLQKVLKNAGFQSHLSNKLINDIWYKLIINSVINPLTALLGIRNGELLQHSGLKVVMRQLFEEACAVASRTGIHVSDQEALWTMLGDVCLRTARNRSSMLQDLEAGKPTELMWINGAIIRIARDVGVTVPTHETIVHLLQAKEENR